MITAEDRERATVERILAEADTAKKEGLARAAAAERTRYHRDRQHESCGQGDHKETVEATTEKSCGHANHKESLVVETGVSCGQGNHSLIHIDKPEEDKDKKQRQVDADTTQILEDAPSEQARQPSLSLRANGALVPAATPQWPVLVDTLDAAKRAWMKDPHGLSGGIDRQVIETQLQAVATGLARQGYSPNHIMDAAVEAAAEMQGRASDKTSGRASTGAGFVAYFTKVLKSKVEEIDRRVRERDAHIAETEAKAATTKVIQGKRVEAMDKAIAEGQVARAAAGRRALNGAGERPHVGGGVYAHDDQGGTMFGGAAKFAPIAFNPITVQHANQVLREARKHLPEVTVQDVEEAFIEISDAFKPKAKGFGLASNSKDESVPIKKIIEKAADAIRRTYAYAKHGAPEQLAGDAPALLNEQYGGERQMKHDFIVIARSKVALLLAKYPKAATNSDGMRSSYELDGLLKRCWLAALKVASDAGWDGYGPETQARAEEAFELLLKETSDESVRRDEERAPEKEQRWLEDQARKRCRLARVSMPSPETIRQTVETIRAESIRSHGDVAKAMAARCNN